jgi:repressor LexA
MLTARQRDLLVYIEQRLAGDGYPPLFDEMKEALHLRSKSGIHRLIKALEERGFIRRLPNRARSIEVVRGPTTGSTVVQLFPGERPAADGMVDIDFLGKIASVSPRTSLALSNTPARVLASMAPIPRDYFVVEVSGNWMGANGILDGDRLLFHRDNRAETGAIVLVVIDDEEAVVRRIRVGQSGLLLEASGYVPDVSRILPFHRVSIMGRLTALLRKYENAERAR